MAEPKTRQTGASVDAFLDSVDNDTRRADARKVVALMRDVTGEEPRMYGKTIVGFGHHHYRYARGREGDWFLVGFSPRKSSLVLYIMEGFSSYEALRSSLGKHETGRACLYVNKLADVDLDVLHELIEGSVAHMRAAYD